MIFSKAKIFFLFALNSVYFTLFSQTSEPYNWSNLPLGGGGFVSAVIAHPKTQNVIYARTDVGGAYRWVQASKTWVPLNDWSSIDELGLLGIESLALDPNNAAKVYILAGTSYFNNGKTAILISNDYGATFTVVDVSNQFKAHGNGMGRQTGEKLAVDPKNSNILFCGTRRDGLFKSTNGGTSWSKVTSFPLTTSPNDNGITFVQFDTTTVTGGITQRIYIGFSRMGASNFYVSTDAGNTWNPVTGHPTNFIPQRVARASNGTMYITYGNGVGPHGHWDPASETMADGAVWKYVPTGNVWTNITPLTGCAYGGVTVDPGNTNRVIVSTINKYLQQPWGWGDKIFISTNGGSGWTDMFGSNKIAMSNNGIPWIDGHAIHWAGCLTIDPFNTERVFVTSGNGIFMTENISAATSTWSFMTKGIEETVPLDIVNSVNGPVVTVIGDYDGSVYNNLTTYPTLHSPQIGTSTGIDVAADNSLMVRVGGASDGSNFPIYYSTNKGSSWTAFSSKPNNSTFYKGRAAVSANGATVIWGPENSSTLYKTTNRGGAWTAVTGISLTNAYPVADGVNANKFYIANGNTIYVSTNAGSSFSAAGTTANTDLKKIRTVPGVEGDIWAPTGTNGLYRSTNSGTSFSKINTVSSCAAVGFGKAAQGKTFPTVFIWGTVGSITGIFRSIDAGATWVRVNDDAHEYGGTANGQFVIGDMNTYGTVYMSTAGRGTVVGTANASDTQAPTTPGTITFSAITQNSFTATWTASTDNVAVTGYEVLLNGALHSTVTTNSISLTVLTCNTAYTIQIRAKDAAGNLSAYNTQASTTTTNIAAPTITNTTPTLCAGGTISLSIPTTTGATYAWSGPSGYTATTAAISRTNATTAMSGTYSATVTLNGCTSTASTTTVTVNAVPTAPTITNTTPTLCAGGTISLSIPTTTGATYAWSGPSGYTATTAAISRTNATTAMSGTYSATITLNGCTSTASTTTVTVNAVPTAPTITNTTPTLCASGTISLSIPTTTGATYAWSGPSGYTATTAAISRTNATTAMSGTYSATITLNGCTSSASTTTVTVNAVPTAPTVTTPITYQQNATSIALSANGIALIWYTEATGGTGNTTAPTPSTATIGTTTHYVSQTVSGCESPRSAIEVTITVAPITQTIELQQGWNLFSISVVDTADGRDAIHLVFTGLDVQIVKNADGFWKQNQAEELNSLQTIDAGKGYLVYMNTAGTLTITGIPCTGESLFAPTGWQLIGYPCTGESTLSPIPISNYFNATNCQIIKNFEGFWEPNGTSNSITNFEQGKAYYLKF